MIPVNTDADMLAVLRRLGKEKLMPIFKYSCPECKKTEEKIRKIADANKVVWCSCGEQMELTPAVPSRFVRGSGSWSSPA